MNNPEVQRRGERAALAEIVTTVTTSDKTGSGGPASENESDALSADPIAGILKESDPE